MTKRISLSVDPRVWWMESYRSMFSCGLPVM